MADDDTADAYFDDDDGLDWMYVEDTCPLADELAENTLPDPGYAGTSSELAQMMWDFDLFDYWDDLEYGDDSYWDSGTAVVGQKRKRSDEVRKKGEKAGLKKIPAKRRQLSLKEMSGGTSMFVSMEERRKLWSRRAPVRKGLKTFALLPDWRKRCAQADKSVAIKAMPAEMRQAAEGNDEDAAEEDEHGDMHDGQDDELAVDPNALMAVLRQKLGSSGSELQMEGMSQDKLMELAMKMMSGDPGTEDAVSDLARSLTGAVERAEKGVPGQIGEGSAQDPPRIEEEEGEGDWEDEEEDGDEEAEDGASVHEGEGIDMEVLQTVLRQKLGDAGLGGVGEVGFMEAIQKMLAGGEGADDMMGELANSLLGQGQGSAASGWLSQQGVSLDEEQGNDDDADSVATAELPETFGLGKCKGAQISPPDSAVEMVNRRTSQLPLHDGSPKAAKKRLASMAMTADDGEQEGGRGKRKRVTFDVPGSQETEAVGAAKSTDVASDGPSLAPEVPATVDEPTTKDSQPTPEPTVLTNPTRASKARAAKATASTTDDDSTQLAKAQQPIASKAKTDPTPAAPGPAKSTRKRKAAAEENEPPTQPAKKVTRKAATEKKDSGGKDGGAEEGKPSYARATRATRARAGGK